MITPTVHMNGTSRSELLDQQLNAMQAIREAIEAMRTAAPNGRDYYPQGPNAIVEAGKAHLARVALMESVHDELEAIALAIHG